MSWERVKLGKFLKARDNRFKPNDKAIKGLRRVDKIDFTGVLHLSDAPSKTDMILVKNGDLLISGINVAKGAVIVYEGKDDIVATIHYSSYVFDERQIDIEFLKLFLKSPEFLDAIKEQVPGGIKTEIKPKHFLPLEIEMPTEVAEQREIIKYFSSVQTKHQALTQELTHQRSLVKQLRHAFLREAMRGKLVPQGPIYEPASELLKKIKAEKEQLIKEGKLRKEKELQPIRLEEMPFEIPKSWVWCRLGEICDFITKGTTPPLNKIKRVEKIPYLKVYNIVNQQIDFAYKPQFVDMDTHNTLLSRSKVFPGDVLMNIVGPPLGKVALVPETYQEWNINQALAIFRPIVKKINKYLYWYLREGSEINKLIPLGVVGQDNLSLEQCRNLIFPMPPLQEQHHIIVKLEQLMNLCDDLEQSIKQSKTKNEQLLQQVLRETLQPRKEYEMNNNVSLAAEP